ncbi:hypothetical protein VCRA2119O147_260013 [Vibrio crassostreae]|nr:hypothetical protein VCRA2119O147_260013 [Vibrio crassostreae]CAK2969948.1 hypothetical protein VCRA2110O183_510001 [Vibrio crassostreae]CAK3004324.1 hypothetical protein VCRA2121O264_490002 [Vibrio crassostreae]CAK3713342.1 hypothetical protein VCRA2121O262_510002 [Vibrio crassostreae]
MSDQELYKELKTLDMGVIILITKPLSTKEITFKKIILLIT